MLQIPLIGQYIQRYVKKQAVADSVDLLNYYWTSLLFAFLSLMISAKQYFGAPIQCWVPMEFRGGWEKYTEDYCFIQNSYYVPFEEPVPDDLHQRRDQLSYYRWVPIVLSLQALMFYVPNWFWNMLQKQTALAPYNALREARKCRNLQGADREAEVANVAEYIADRLSYFEDRYDKRGICRSGNNAVLLYLMTKLFYLGNIVLQLVLLNQFLGNDYFHWGYATILNVINGREWQESPIFPRVRRLGNIQRHTVQCVIMMNMINEKMYLFLWCWLLLIAVCTTVNCLYYFVMLGLPAMRARLITYHLPCNIRKLHRYEVSRFVHHFLRPDGVLLLQFVREHVGGRVTRDLVNALWTLFSKQAMIDEPEILKHHPTTPEPNNESNYYGNLGQTSFSTRNAFINTSSPRSGRIRQPVTAPYLEDYIDGGTLRVGSGGSSGSPGGNNYFIAHNKNSKEDTEV